MRNYRPRRTLSDKSGHVSLALFYNLVVKPVLIGTVRIFKVLRHQREVTTLLREIKRIMRVSYNGITLAFQARHAGSTPATRSTDPYPIKRTHNMTPISQIENKIREFSKSTLKLVVGIDGYSGIGKTTLLKELAKRNKQILPVFRDDFVKPRKAIEQLLRQASDKSIVMERGWVDNDNLKAFIMKYRESDAPYVVNTFNSVSGEQDLKKTFDFSKRVMVIEGIFLLHPELLGDQFDLKIFVTGDTTAADERRILREKKRWGKDYFPETHPDSYVRLIKIAFARYEKTYNPQALADLTVKV